MEENQLSINVHPVINTTLMSFLLDWILSYDGKLCPYNRLSSTQILTHPPPPPQPILLGICCCMEGPMGGSYQNIPFAQVGVPSIPRRAG